MSTPPPPSQDLRDARYQLVISLVATLLLGVGLSAGYQFATTQRRGCSEASEDLDCAEDEVCVHGRCRRERPREQPLPCQEGDACDTCECGAPFHCAPETQRCVPPVAPACAPEVAALVAAVRAFERERCTKTGGKVTECDPKQLEEFIVSHQQFDELLLRLDQTVSVHFDNGQPDAQRGLSPRAARFYAGSFAQLEDRMRSAAAILVLGRASKERRASPRAVVASNNLVQNRISYVANWIIELETTPLARDAMADKLIQLAIGAQQPLTPELLARKLPLHRVIAGRQGRVDQIRGWLSDLETLDADDELALDRLVNQSVLVIPIPASCELPP